MMVEMKVSGLTMDPLTNMPILVLKDETGSQVVPIWIGLIEASAIATELERIQLARPMTHDLLHQMLTRLSVRVDRVEVTDVRDSTFFASIFLVGPTREPIEIDSRPSDAVALALRAGAPILVAKRVIERAGKAEVRPSGQAARGAKIIPLRPDAAADPAPPRKRAGVSMSARRGGQPTPVPVRDEPRARATLEPEVAIADALADNPASLLENLPDEDFPKWKM
jgi:bifunctional DNase/RNase